MQTHLRLVRLGATLDANSTTNLGDTTAKAATSGLIVQSYCTQVAQQPDITIPSSVVSKLPPVNEYLKLARANTTDYLTNIQPKILIVVTDVAGYAAQFGQFSTLITGKINDWKGGSPTARQDALDLLQALQQALQTKLNGVNGVKTSLAGFQTKLNVDISNFNTASNTANTVIGGDQGAIAELNRQISDMDGRIAGAATGVALSGLTIIGGALMIAAGAIASFITAGTSTPLIVAGVAVVVVGAAGLTASSIVLSQLIDAKAGLISQKAALDADLKFLTTFKSTMGTLGTSATEAATQINNMSNAWGLLSGNLGNVVGSIQQARNYSDLPVVVQAYLNTAGGQWQQVQANTQIIQQQMTGVQLPKLPDNQLNGATLRTLRAA
ncbi:MAG: HBL/NHE enterotoxin family protein [Rhodopila sp.]|nr:HBL/NHE enterotoxin family protein [Rhodopila sp.]